MENYRIIRIYRVIMYIMTVLTGFYWLWFLMTTDFRDFRLFVLTVILAALSMINIVGVIQLITLALNLNDETTNHHHELSENKKNLREMKLEIESLKRSVASLEGALPKPAPPVAPPEPTSPVVQVRARVRANDTLLASPSGAVAVGVNGLPLKVIEGQGVYLIARSADGGWYRFSPDRVSFGWLAADALEIGDTGLLDQLPVEG